MEKENTLRVGIMQPYFLPYLGYFQLIQKCDIFVLYDDVQFTKKGWISRNYLGNSSNTAWPISLPTLASKTETLIRDKIIAKEFKPLSMLARIENEYQNTERNWEMERALLRVILSNNERNLFKFLRYSIVESLNFFGIDKTCILTSSEVGDFKHLKGESKVLAILSSLNAHSYLNPISGRHLYNTDNFDANRVRLEYLNPFIPATSVCGSQPLSIFHALIRQGIQNTTQDVSLGEIFRASQN